MERWVEETGKGLLAFSHEMSSRCQDWRPERVENVDQSRKSKDAVSKRTPGRFRACQLYHRSLDTGYLFSTPASH